MSGTKAGGKKAAYANTQLYGRDFYARIGRMGGKLGKTGGFWHAKYVLKDVEFIRQAGKKGGAVSKRV